MRHFYHVFCGWPWQEIVSAHVEALIASGVTWEVTVGLIGTGKARFQARGLFSEWLPDVDFVEAGDGYEQVTLTALHDWARRAAPGAPVLYAHSKGVIPKTDPMMGLHGRFWRELMTTELVGHWRKCVNLLADHDAVGCYWATPQMYPDFVETPMFAGNFWWASAGYLATLPPIGNDSRYQAEGWVGLGDPAVADVHPGWPTWAEFAPQVIAALNPGGGSDPSDLLPADQL